MDRRAFLAATLAPAAAALGAALPAAGRVRSQEQARRPIAAVGLQLYTIRTELQRDVEGSLRRVAELGYREVELAGLAGRSAAELRALLDRHGLAAPAGHFPLPSLQPAELPRTLEVCAVLGHRWLVCPFLPANERTLDHYRRHAELFDSVGEACRAAGIRFAYHNHDFELAEADGVVPLDLLLRETSPQLVDFELDLYWVTKGGGDPLDYFARFPGRFALWHVKDMDATEQRSFAEVGTGTIPFPAIFARSEEAGVKHYFVEQDVVQGEIWGVLERSRRHVAGLLAARR
jgi:sugar phosphate isomerase/epimerase